MQVERKNLHLQLEKPRGEIGNYGKTYRQSSPNFWVHLQQEKIIGCTYSKRKDRGEKTLGVGNKERKPGSMASQIVLNWMMKNSLQN